MDNIIKYVKGLKYYDELYDLPWKLKLNKKITKKHYNNVNVALINVPCGGFGDVIACKTLYDYFTDWYPTLNTYICTPDIDNFKTLQVDTENMIKLKRLDNTDCPPLSKLKLTKKKKFDIIIVVPVVKREFFIEEIKPLIPYATYFNTFTMSEYNGIFEKYTFPIGIGKSQLGLLLNNVKFKKHNLIKSPYALIYIQPPDLNFPHANHCFLEFIRMISNKYNFTSFQVVVPDWIVDIIRCYLNDPQPGTCYKINKKLKEYTKNYPNVIMIDEHGKKYIIKNCLKCNKTMIIRGDILPKPRNEFISLIKYSVDDVLLTGDQSITDAFSCCVNKIIWYQIAPWKKKFSTEMSKYIPDKYFKTFKTSCGTIKGIHYHPKYIKFLDKFDFRKNGKPIIDAILLFNYNKSDYKDYIQIVESSRKISSVINKLNKIN